MESPDKIIDIQKLFNDAAKKHAFENDIFERKILLEKCYKGREMSSLFLKGISRRIENIHDKLDDLEIKMENDIENFLKEFSIYASKKSDKYSLPYTNVVVSKLMWESNMDAMFNFKRTYRDIVKELLNKDVYKIRYYIHIETYGDESSKIPAIFNRGGIKYNFRYYIH